VLAAPGTRPIKDTPPDGQARRESPSATRHQPGRTRPNTWPIPATPDSQARRGMILRSVVMGGLSRCVREWLSSGTMFQACRRSSVAGYSHGSSLGSSRTPWRKHSAACVSCRRGYVLQVLLTEPRLTKQLPDEPPPPYGSGADAAKFSTERRVRVGWACLETHPRSSTFVSRNES
jgi:hypothetical protein